MDEENKNEAVENTVDEIKENENNENVKEEFETEKDEKSDINDVKNDIKAENTDKTKPKKKKIKPPKKASNIKKIKAIKPSSKSIVKFVNKNRTALIAIFAIIVLLIIAFLFNSNNIIKIGEKQVMFSKEYSMSSKADFYVSGENIFYVSKDGMLFLDKKGTTLWSDTFTMSSPYMLNDGGYAAVADSNSKTVNVYDKTGRLYQISTAGEITTFAVNPIGCCAVVCKVGEDYRVDVYSNTGETMFEGSRASKDGIPIGIDVSDDGTVVGITLVDYNDIKIKSSVQFYYTTKSEAQSTESSDGLVSAVEIPEAIAGIVKFLPNRHCIVASDKSMMNIDCSRQNSFNKKWEKTFDNYVTAFDIVNNEYIAVAYGESMSVSDETAIGNENTVHWYNLNGRETGYAKADDRITDISSSSRGTIITVDKEFIAYTSRGRELWRYAAIQNVLGMQFYNSVDRVILVTPTKMQLLDVKKGVAMQEESETESTTSVEGTTAVNSSETTTAAQSQ
ncbi:MAG: DUF5711 family protein [Clostridia bacterium]|nr:DUF5711 family protein [Clostridia bacterium]